ncbi:MAG: DUF134 domain-containing protein [Desulfobacteraceae bacterium]|nr:DUF134 domain-containing protein [Desulfobacteraceae bacterium]
MVRPQKNRIVGYNPDISYFKPRGIPMFDLEEVCLTVDERESIRLADFMGLSHEEAGQCMGVSRATFGRIVQRARKIVADALIHGKAINVEGGNFRIVEDSRCFQCEACYHEWQEPRGTGRPEGCPECSKDTFHRISKQ